MYINKEFNIITNVICETFIMYARIKSWPSVMFQIIHLELFAFGLNIISDSVLNKKFNSTTHAKDIKKVNFCFLF